MLGAFIVYYYIVMKLSKGTKKYVFIILGRYEEYIFTIEGCDLKQMNNKNKGCILHRNPN